MGVFCSRAQIIIITESKRLPREILYYNQLQQRMTIIINAQYMIKKILKNTR